MVDIDKELSEEIQSLREQRNAVLLVHNYQRSEIHDIADFMYNEAPLGCWRRKERIDNWIEKGGLHG